MSRSHRRPPRLATALLQRFVREDLLDEVLGDLEEKYAKMLRDESTLKANLNYWYQTINYLRPFALKRRKQPYKPTGMFINNVKIGWRQMVRQKMYSGIKIGGFSLGIAASLLIALYIIDELSFDSQPPQADRIYRVYQRYQAPDKMHKWVWMQAPFAKTIKLEFPEIEMVGRYNDGELFGAGSGQIRRDDQPDNTFEEGIAYMDGELLQMLEVPVVYGDLVHALDEPGEIVITRKKSEKYFGTTDPVGKLLVLNNGSNVPLKIGAVIEDWPSNSHLQFDFMIGMTGREMWPGEQDYWGANNYPTYVRVREGTDPNELAKKLMRAAENYIAPFERKGGNPNIDEFLKNTSYGLQPIRDIHLTSAVEDITSPVKNDGDLRFVWLFGAVAVFIVLIACVNFINLSTAKSASRAKEVGLRKTVGSYRSNIIRQFLVESIIFSIISFVIGVLLAWVLLPSFNAMAGKALVFPWTQTWFFPAVIGSSIVVGLVAGLYPSLYLSSFRPAEVLKGSFARSNKNAVMRSTLVVFQFATSAILIMSTVVIYRQMNFILNTKLGYDKEQVLIIQGTRTLGDQIPALKEELLNLSAVKSVSVSDYLPINGMKRNGNTFYNEGKQKIDDGTSSQFWVVDHDYVTTLGLRVTEGRFFDRNMASDSGAIVINQKMATKLGLTEPVGKVIFNYRNWTVIGVVEDFHFASLRNSIEPLAMVIGNADNAISVKLASADLPAAIAEVQEVWRKFSPHQPIRLTFLDESFERMYDDVRRMGNVLTSFAILAIVVACLGLFALSAYTVEQRGKEISIRLVLGASVRNVFGLLTFDFVKLVLIAIVIASPAAWYIMTEWLHTFTYRTTVGWDVFAVAGLISILIALSTISYQSIRAGLVKPANNLRSE